MNLLGRTKIVNSLVPQAGSVGGLTEIEVDCTGFDRVCHLIHLGAAAGASTFDFKVQEAAATGMAGASDITGAALTQVAAAGANKIYAIDVPVNPAKPFQKAVAVVGTADFACSAVAILYEGSGKFPKTAATEAIIL
jgi:hypothetical protein